MSPSNLRGSEPRSSMLKFPEVEFNCGHFDWKKNATFKYVLIELTSPKESRYLVRGMTSAEFHAESAEPTLRQIDTARLGHNVIGGGRIRYIANTKHLTVYGYSMGYPWPNGEYRNELVAEIIRRNFPNLTVEWTNDGY